MINFLRFRGLVGIFTVVWMLGFAGLAIHKYQKTGSVFSYSIDFEGGTQVHLHFDTAISAQEAQRSLAPLFSKEVVIRSVDESDLIVRIQDSFDTKNVSEVVITQLQKTFPHSKITLIQAESVGPGVGESLWRKSLQAILLSMIVILLYLALRFWSFAFSIGAVLALLHDAISILALILFLDRPISINIISSIVAILGFSINDTIVIFSQIRDYMEQFRGESLYTITNRAITKTLRRTMLTSLSTSLPLIIMYFFGGEALTDFSLTLIAGIVFGTFSSIFIASPLFLLFYPHKNVS